MKKCNVDGCSTKNGYIIMKMRKKKFITPPSYKRIMLKSWDVTLYAWLKNYHEAKVDEIQRTKNVRYFKITRLLEQNG